MVDYPIKEENINVFQTRKELGITAGQEVENRIIQLLESKEEIRMVFASAPSQEELLTYLASSEKIEWNRIVAFHMDEYLGLTPDASQLFSHYLSEKLFHKRNLKKVHIINSQEDSEKEIKRYEELIREKPIDIICLGIGENGHIAFNDPPTADFSDKKTIKKVQLDYECRMQQVNDGCFNKIEDVPIHALTLTIPVLMSGKYLFCVVPGKTKAQAVANTLQKPVSTLYPSTILRKHSDCRFYFDDDSYNL